MNCSKGIHDRGDDFMDFKPEVLLHIEGIDPLVSEVFLKAMHLQGMRLSEAVFGLPFSFFLCLFIIAYMFHIVLL